MQRNQALDVRTNNASDQPGSFVIALDFTAWHWPQSSGQYKGKNGVPPPPGSGLDFSFFTRDP